MKHLRYALIALSLFYSSWAFASTCFWVPIVVSGAVSGTGSVCRLTITAITGSGLLAGDTVIVAGLIGATECNGTTTISTVVDSTHIELTGTTFTSAYVSGGTVAGGHWTTTNTAMWASGTGGTVGTCAATGGVPKQAADTAVFDGSSGGGTVTVDSTINGVTLTQITMGAFTGTLDFSVNNPSITLQKFSITGSGTRTLKLGSGTYTLTGIAGDGNLWDASTVTGLTFTPGTSTLALNVTAGTAADRVLVGGGLTYNAVSLLGNTNAWTPFIITGSNTIATLNISAGVLLMQNGGTQTITNAFTWTGTAAHPIFIGSGTQQNASPGLTISVTSGTATCAWCIFQNAKFQGGATFTASNSFDFGGNSGITITNPIVGGGGGHIIGG